MGTVPDEPSSRLRRKLFAVVADLLDRLDNLIDLVPLPVWKTEFQPGVYARAAMLGVVVPLVSAAIPIWRAVRVEPIEAIRTSHLAARRPPRLLRRVRIPGSSLNQMPLRTLLRTPRRTASHA